VVVIDGWFPLFYDNETSVQLRGLQACRHAEPDRPLLLQLGSSRTAMAFRPDLVGPLQATPGPQPLVFNYSHFGAPPVFHLQQLKRLLGWGIKPRWLVLELMPVHLSEDMNTLVLQGALAPELPELMRYIPPGKLLGRYTVIRLIPWHRNRTKILEALAPAWSLEAPGEGFEPRLGHRGWDPRVTRETLDARELRRRTDITRESYGLFAANFQIKEHLTRPIEDLIHLCRRENIELALVLTPESTEFRSWYRPGADREIQRYCADLVRKHGLPVIDGRGWLSDEEFMDGHHVLLNGANTFTRRLEREVLKPLVNQGRFTAALQPRR